MNTRHPVEHYRRSRTRIVRNHPGEEATLWRLDKIRRRERTVLCRERLNRLRQILEACRDRDARPIRPSVIATLLRTRRP